MGIRIADENQGHILPSPYALGYPLKTIEGAMGVVMRVCLYVMASEISTVNPKQIQKAHLLRSAVYSSFQTHATHPILRASIIRC
jgi:hypothetical protein